MDFFSQQHHNTNLLKKGQKKVQQEQKKGNTIFRYSMWEKLQEEERFLGRKDSGVLKDQGEANQAKMETFLCCE